MQMSPEERSWGMFAHLAGLAFFTGVPGANVLGPLIIWLIKKDEMPFVDSQGKEAINFQIIMLIYLLISFVLCFLCIGYVLLPAVVIVNVVFVVVAAIETNKGFPYRYPLTFRFIR